jgi:Ferritin-like
MTASQAPVQNLKIVELMQKPKPKRDLLWLRGMLQSALELELSTLPPYLCGLYALDDPNQSSVPSQLILNIVFQEMTHFGLACNMLRAAGEQPLIFDGYDAIVYPGQLPGGVRPKCDCSFFPCDPNFEVQLGFADYKSFVRMCMQIEYPEDPVPKPPGAVATETFPSIGEFYDAISEGFVKIPNVPYDTSKQITYETKFADPVVFVVDTLQEALHAITTIQTEGEGGPRYPFYAPGKLAHFYAFGEIYFQKRYVYDAATKTGDWTGDAINVPQVYPMTPVPLGGYANPPREVLAVDQDFTAMLQYLDQAWANGDRAALTAAIAAMGQLKKAATNLLSKQIPRNDGEGIFGPQFRKSNS